jgi:hypothetical protein
VPQSRYRPGKHVVGDRITRDATKGWAGRVE